MIFRYLDVDRRFATRELPVIPIRVCGPANDVTVFALVDSGSEHSVLSLNLIKSLGLSDETAEVVEIIGVGGKFSRGYMLDVEHRLGPHRWTAPAIFSDAVESPMILGQAGFFEYFNVTFKRSRSLMDIRWARSRPRRTQE